MAISTLKEITEWSAYIVNKNEARVKEQRTDQEFFEDTFRLPIVEDEKYVLRQGFIAGMVNGITQLAIAFVPKVYTEAKNKTSQAGADRVASKANKWVKSLSKQSVNPFRETFKKLIGTRGEAWIGLNFNQTIAMWNRGEDWRDYYPDILPVNFMLYDPMIVFHDPAEEIDGRPKRVLVKGKRLVSDIKRQYPQWSNPNRIEDNKEVDFKYFIDDYCRFCSADDEPLFRDLKGDLANGEGILTNIYGIVPFVHKYSGYGTTNEKVDPDLLVYTRTRMIRDKVIEDSAMATDFRYNQHEQAWAVKNIYIPDGVNVSTDILKNYKKRPNTINVIQGTGGAKIEKEESSAFGADAYAYRDRVRADLNSEYPLPIRGIASGTSGRQEDILGSAAMADYDSPLESNGQLWSEAMDMAVKMCFTELFDMLPAGLNKGDEKSYSELRVDIKKEDPTAMSRKAAEGDRRYQMGIIDLEELYSEYMGKTKDEAMRLKARVWIEQAMREDPAFRQLIIQTAAEEMGREEQLARIKEMIAGGAGGLNPTPNIGERGGEQRLGNIRTAEGMEQADLATRKETRLPPQGVYS